MRYRYTKILIFEEQNKYLWKKWRREHNSWRRDSKAHLQDAWITFWATKLKNEFRNFEGESKGNQEIFESYGINWANFPNYKASTLNFGTSRFEGLFKKTKKEKFLKWMCFTFNSESDYDILRVAQTQQDRDQRFQHWQQVLKIAWFPILSAIIFPIFRRSKKVL